LRLPPDQMLVIRPTVQFSRSGGRLTASLIDEGAAGLSKLNSMQAGKPLPDSVDISGKAHDISRRPDPKPTLPIPSRTESHRPSFAAKRNSTI
jgi:hypothetical protein